MNRDKNKFKNTLTYPFNLKIVVDVKQILPIKYLPPQYEKPLLQEKSYNVRIRC